MNVPYPWLESNAHALEALRQAGRLPHGLLLTGRPGWGEAFLAEWLVQKLLAQELTVSARLVAHPDLRWIEATEDSREIKIDQIRLLNEFAYSTVQSAPCKVAVLHEADRMNRAAANALLKTLEEPPANTFLILTTAKPGRVPATILSRCQRFEINQSRPQAQAWLEQTLQTADVVQRLDEYGGAPLKAFEAAQAGLMSIDVLTGKLRSADAARVRAAVLEYDMADLVERWQRLLIKLIAAQADPDLRLFEFADELTWFLRQVEGSNSANVALLFDRLAYRWNLLRDV
ncbi:MAG: AAA family ATPase [Proteobacteria bacterium]|nr:AAA family ATPase [Pseudomonadota bacterium]